MYHCIMKKSSLYKGCLEPILLRLLKDNGRMYGYLMTQMVKEITKGELSSTKMSISAMKKATGTSIKERILSFILVPVAFFIALS